MMDAKEARALTEASLSGPALQPFMARITEAIEAAARKGARATTVSATLGRLTTYQRGAIVAELKRRSFGE